jgi:hypothetical protein
MVIIKNKEGPVCCLSPREFRSWIPDHRKHHLDAARYRTSVLYANLGQQLRCRVLARASDFDQVHRDFTASLCSLRWLKGGG